jgi:hypothetical protein
MPRTRPPESVASNEPKKNPEKKDGRRKTRSRPMPKLLTGDADALDELAKRRCLMVLSVLSGQRPVSDVIEEAQLSRQTYYQLEIRAIQGMLRELGTSHGSVEAQMAHLQADNTVLKKELAKLQTANRRLEHLLLVTRKVLKSGPMTLAKRGRPRKVHTPRSASIGTSDSSGSKTVSKMTTESPSSSSIPMKTSTAEP